MACSLCADGVRRYSARINAFILLPLYYSGTAQGSQGGTKNDPECPPRCSGHNLRKIILVFVNLENLRIFQIYFFTGGVVKANGIARFFRSAALPKEAALQMQFIAAPLPVKRDPRSVRRRSGGSEIINLLSAEIAQSEAERNQNGGALPGIPAHFQQFFCTLYLLCGGRHSVRQGVGDA